MNDPIQNPNWYQKNKDNFSKSLKKLNLVKNSDKLQFYNYDLTRFGKLRKLNLRQPISGLSQHAHLWIIEIPAGLQVYHASRALTVNNSEFPLPLYSINKTAEQNQQTEADRVEKLRVEKCYAIPEKFNSCVTNSYYATYPQQIYLHQNSDNTYLGPQIRYSYGLDAYGSDGSLNSINNPLYNNRTASVSNVFDLGIVAYTLRKRVNLIAFPDDFLVNRGFLGVHNMLVLLHVIYGSLYQQLFTNRTYGDAILSSTGLSLGANMREFSDGNKAFGIQKSYDILYPAIKELWTHHDQINFEQLGLIKYIYQAFHEYIALHPQNNLETNFKEFLEIIYENNYVPGLAVNDQLQQIYGQPIIPGVRNSTFIIDRPWHTLVKMFAEQNLSGIQGLGGGQLFTFKLDSWTPIFSNGIITVDESLQSKFFHSELIAFYAPNILEHNYNNPFDYRYRLNSLGVITEMRKYKTTNILTEQGGFHQGFLYEHSSWVALWSQIIDQDNRHLIRSGPNELTILTAGLLHDIGKAGQCNFEPPEAIDYQDFDPHQIPKPYWCKIVTQGSNDLGFVYRDLPIHPERGYRVLKGLSEFWMSQFDSNQQLTVGYNLVSKDWDQLANNVGLSWEQMKMIRIATACHWIFGPVAGKFKADPQLSLVEAYLRKIERYYNAEFGKFSVDKFVACVYLTLVVSVADLYGALASNTLENNTSEHVLNQPPNYPIELLTLVQYITALWNSQAEKVMNASPEMQQVFKRVAEERDVQKKVAILHAASNYFEVKVMLNQVFADLEHATSVLIVNKSGPPVLGYISSVQQMFEPFFNAAVQVLQTSFKPNPRNTFMVLNNLLYSYTDTAVLCRGNWRWVPKVIIFDLDFTLFHAQNDRRGRVKYRFYPDIKNIIAICQTLRTQGIKVAIASRHYISGALLEEVADPSSPLYYKNFDIIVSQFTGSKDALQQYCQRWGAVADSCVKYLDPCKTKHSFSKYDRTGQPTTECPPESYGFILDSNGNYYLGEWDPTQSKAPHLEIIERVTATQAPNMILFDDDPKYITGTGLGNHPVYTAGVNGQFGLTEKLFYTAIAMFIYDRFVRSE
jgi:hypothetical protein